MRITKFFPVSRERYEKLKEKYENLEEVVELCKDQRDKAELNVVELLFERKEKHKKAEKMINLYKHERDRAKCRIDVLISEREESEKVMFSVSVSLGEAHKTLKKLKYGYHHESMGG